MVLHHNMVNPNETWVNSPGFQAFYVVVVIAVHLVLLSVPVLSTEVAWTLTNVIHSVTTFYFLHWLKGAPFNTMDEGEAARLTQWEQITHNNELSNYQRFFIAAPVIVFFLAIGYTHHEPTFFIVNLAFLALAIVPKIPGLYGVRIWGINRY